jgi:predicted metal-dependent hydrolase
VGLLQFGFPLRLLRFYATPAKRAKRSASGENGGQRLTPVTDSATFTTPEASDEDLGDLLLEVLPTDGSTIGNMSAREARIQQYLQSWYRTSALERLQEKTTRYAEQIGVSPTGVSVRNFRSGWGSCDKRGQVVFNWNIIKAPHSIVDYVVIHELCHLIHPNHSKDFWQLVGRYDAAYPEHRQWLKERGEGLL